MQNKLEQDFNNMKKELETIVKKYGYNISESKSGLKRRPYTAHFKLILNEHQDNAFDSSKAYNDFVMANGYSELRGTFGREFIINYRYIKVCGFDPEILYAPIVVSSASETRQLSLKELYDLIGGLI